MTFYRVYRSQHFSEVLGQKIVTTILQQALIQERLSHAYLFSGPRGTGKTSTARIFGRATVCLHPKKTKTSFEPCNECTHCLAILENRTSDFVEIDAASNRGIESIRDLREEIQYHPTELGKRIYIIDEVHMLTIEAFNALLKTLEEPPEYCYFILATTELHKVPVTIRSRCQLLRFERGSTHSIEAKLTKIIDIEKITIEPAALTLIAEHADGGFRDAETLLESLSTQKQSITLADVEAALGALPVAEVKKLLQAALRGDIAETTTLLEGSIHALPGSLERLTTQLINTVRGYIYEKKEYSSETLVYALEQLLESYILQKNSPLPALPLEIALLNIAGHGQVGGRIESAPPEPVAVTSTVQTKTVATVIEPVKVAPPTEVPVVELRNNPIGDPRKAWKLMIEEICRENIVLGQSLKQTVFHTAENAVITIYVRYTFHSEKMNEKKNRNRIHQILHNLTGQEWTVTYIVNSTLPKRGAQKSVGPGIEDAAAVFGSTK